MNGQWILLQDGSIGVYMRDEKGVPMIASGEPGNYTAYDTCPNGLRPDCVAIIGSVEHFPTSKEVIDHVRRMREYCDRLLENIEY